MMTEEATLYQHGTLALLVPGLLEGTQTVAELMQHGNTGIGTLTGLDGELIILDGVVYQVNHEGRVRIVEGDARVPFANVHKADFGQGAAITATNMADLKVKMQGALTSPNLFAAVMVRGTFGRMHTRAVQGQQQPYPTLLATATAQSEFKASGVTGTLMGYYSPALYAGAVAPGFHLHFLSDDHQFGGHVLDLADVTGSVAVQTFTDFNLHLPTTSKPFLTQDFSGPEIIADIEAAEH
mgnify:CR=1 FL=1